MVLLSYPQHSYPSFAAARRRIVDSVAVLLADAPLAVDVVVADWLEVDHLSRKDASKAVVVVFLSRSTRMSRSEFFRSCRNGIFHEVRGRESCVRILETARLGIFMKTCRCQGIFIARLIYAF